MIYLHITFIVKHTTYAEYSDHLILTVRNKETRINYIDIQNFYFADNKLVIIDNNQQKVKINLVWFRPILLINTLQKMIEQGKFEHLSDSELNDLVRALEIIIAKYKINS